MESNQEIILAAYRRWLLRTAWEYADNYHDAQDLAAEGWIAMWKSIDTYDPNKGVKFGTHLMSHAHWRMAEVCERGKFTGMSSRAGKRHTAGTKRNRGREQSVDMSLSDYDVEQVYVDVELAYHHGAIIAAINALPIQQRQRVYDRFWREIYDPKNSAWWYAKNIGARDRLAEQLMHLADEFGGRVPSAKPVKWYWITVGSAAHNGYWSDEPPVERRGA